MKFYLLAGGLLITAASVYGITDYMNTKNKKEFKNLYKETHVTLKEDVKLQDVNEEDFSRGKLESYTQPKEESRPAVTTRQKKSKVKSKKTIEVVNEIPEIEVIPMYDEVKAPENIPEIKVPPPPPVENKKLKKKLSLKMYSRGAIREEVPLLADTIKKKQ